MRVSPYFYRIFDLLSLELLYESEISTPENTVYGCEFKLVTPLFIDLTGDNEKELILTNSMWGEHSFHIIGFE